MFQGLKELADKSIKLIEHQHGLSKKELIILFKWSTPLIVSNLLNNVGYLFINLVFVGKDTGTEDQLAASSLSNAWTYCTMSLGTGLANAMDTLVSQSFGANNLEMVGLTLQRASVISSGAFFIVAALFCLTEKFLLLVRQDPNVSSLAFDYSLYLLPGVWFQLQTNCLQKYLQCQGVMWPSIVVGFFMNVMNIIFNLIFVQLGYGNFGFKGAALATSISRILAFFAMLAVIKIWKLHKETWFGWKKECLSIIGMWEYFKLAGPASIQHASEAVGFEVLTILAGVLGKLPLEAHSVTYNFTMLTYQFPSGISIATSVRVGQLLGSRDEAMAKRVSWLAFSITLVFMGIIAIIQYSCRHVIGKIYVDDQAIIDLVSELLPICAIFQLFDGSQTIFQGVVRGMGRVITGAVCNFVAFYVISIPLSASFAFPLEIGVKGLWWGLCIGLFTIAVILIIIILKVDWTSEVNKASVRTKSQYFTKDDIENPIELVGPANGKAEGGTTVKVAVDIPHEEYDDKISDKSSNKNENSDDDDDDVVPSSQRQVGGSGSNVNGNDSIKNKKPRFNNRASSHNNFRKNSNSNFRTMSSPDFRSDVPNEHAINRCHPQ